MKNFISKGKVITITASQVITSGVPVLIGELVGVPSSSAAVGEQVAVKLSGVYECDKAAGAVSQGAKLYWDDVAKNVTTTAAANIQIGHAWASQQAGDPSLLVKLMW